MIHFETIWNEAESVSKSYTNLDRKDIFKQIRNALDNLSDNETRNELQSAMGDILFGLCSLCAHLETKKSISINSATALREAIDRIRSEILDPEPPE
jgi:hypothetical protein